MIHVCYALYDANGLYSKFVGTSMSSLFQNTSSPVKIHILHDQTLNEKNKSRFTELTNSCGQLIEFHSVSLDSETFVLMEGSKFSPATLYRLAICEILPDDIEKVIYLDGDTVVYTDIAELWNEPLNDAPLGAVLDVGQVKNNPNKSITPICDLPNVKRERYFNAGVLLLNLKHIRKVMPNFFKDCLKFFREHSDLCRYLDQDILNYFFNENYQQLNYKYNKAVHYEILKNIPISEGIYHYIANFTLGIFDNPYNRLFWKYFSKTPWCDENFIFRTFNLIPKISAHNSSIMRDLVFELCNTPRRKFILSEGDEKSFIQKMFPENEYNVYQDPSTNININRGEIAVFVIPNYEYAKNFLEQNGLKENIDFVDGRLLFSLSGLSPTEQYSLIKDL